MDVKLVVASGKNAGEEMPVSGPRFFIGRAEDCQLRPRSDLISRHHCVILVEEGFVAVRDFGSKNGTFVNGERVLSEAEIKSGDILKIGPLEFEVRLGAEVAPAKAAEKPAKKVEKPAKAERPKAAPAEARVEPPADLAGKKKPKVKSVQEAAARTVQSAGATKHKDEDDDFASWLDDSEEATMAETTAMEPTETEKAVRDTKSTKRAPEPPEEDEEEEEEEEVEEKVEEKKSKAKGSDFSIPSGKSKPSSSTSKDAAANMLKNFFHRR